MPTNVVSLENSKKHLTQIERANRLKAENSLKRARVKIIAPPNVRENENAYKYWKTILKKMSGIELLDDLDANMLAVYCIMLARIDDLNNAYCFNPDDKILQSIQSQERLLLNYADKLGLTPNSRARLAKERAEEPPPDPQGDLYG